MKLVKFAKNPCTPCGMLKGFMESQNMLVDETKMLGENISFEDAQEKFKINTVPTLVLYDDNDVEIDRATGTDFGKVIEIYKKRGL